MVSSRAILLFNKEREIGMKHYRLIGILAGLFLFSILTVTAGFAEEVKKSSSGKMPAEDEFVPVEQVPELIKAATPVYPDEAKEKKITGKVYIRALIDKNGDWTRRL